MGDFCLIANVKHRLDTYLGMYVEYSKNFPRIAHEILKEKQSDHTVIDIGANIGDTAALLRTYGVKNTIHCIEGDDIYFSYLQANSTMFDNVCLLKYYLTDKVTQKGFVVQNSIGSARILESSDVAYDSKLTTLDELAVIHDLGSIAIIKIDTDGYDTKIIRGSLQTIKKHKPVLFFEYDCDLSKIQNEKPIEVLALLAENGYNKIMYFDNFGRFMLATSLDNKDQLGFLDRYIQKGQGAVPYYDVFIFPKEDIELYEKIVAAEINQQ